jgi:hypothetical protein
VTADACPLPAHHAHWSRARCEHFAHQVPAACRRHGSAWRAAYLQLMHCWYVPEWRRSAGGFGDRSTRGMKRAAPDSSSARKRTRRCRAADNQHHVGVEVAEAHAAVALHLDVRCGWGRRAGLEGEDLAGDSDTPCLAQRRLTIDADQADTIATRGRCTAQRRPDKSGCVHECIEELRICAQDDEQDIDTRLQLCCCVLRDADAHHLARLINNTGISTQLNL